MNVDASSLGLVKDPALLRPVIMFWYLLNQMGEGDMEEGYLRFAELCSGTIDEPLKLQKERIAKMLAATKPAMQSFAEDFGEDRASAGNQLWELLTQARDLGQAAMLSYYARAAWYDCGMPTVEVSHKLSAAFMVTQASKDVIEEVMPPFKTFLIEVPDKLIHVKDSTQDALVEVRALLVSRLKMADDVYVWMYFACTTGNVHIWRYGRDLNIFVKGDTQSNVPKGPLDMDLEDIDERAAAMLGRLMINTCMYMTNQGDEARPVGRGHQAYRGPGRRRESPEPLRRVFKLTPDVKHDFRESVRNYIAGVTRKMTVQREVTGHWKHNQVYGPGRSLRKRLFIQPYWRGPADAPIAMGKHKIGEK